jgi:hypothetical protein
MFRLLSDLEVSLNELLVACRKSADHFRDAAQLITEERISGELKQLANEREPFLSTLERKIRELGDLPSMPDPDREDSEMLLHHLGAAVTADYTGKLLQQRIDAEQNIMELINKAKASDDNNVCNEVLTDLAIHANKAIKTLSSLAQLQSETQ